MNHLYRTVVVITAATLAALSSVTAIAQAPAPLRVLGASPDAKTVAKLADPATVKSRIARPDIAVLDEIARHHAATQYNSRFVIDLFPGLDLEAEVIASETRPHGATLFARLTEIELGSAVFTIENGLLTATVDFPGGSFLVTPDTNGHHQVAQKATQLFPPEGAPRTPFSVSRTANPFAPADTIHLAPADSGRLIDIMVVWTPAAETAAGGLAAIQTLAQAAVDSANAAYLNSGIAQRLRLVHRQQVTYTERTNCAGGGSAFDCALDDITDVGDGQLENVHGLRDTHGADLVALLINDGAYCGLAWLPSTPSPNLGFSVTAHNCAVGNKSFLHELGHNMGAHHDPANASAYGPKPFNKGYVSPQLTWRTVMAYPGPCSGCTRLSFFSNPKLTNNGTAMGTAAVSNNAHVLNFTAKDIAAYRATSGLHPIAQRFTDVPTNHGLFGYVEFFAQAEISTGCGGGLYCPDAAVSRRAMAAFLERTMRASNWTPPTTSTTFTDVASGSLLAGHIEAMRTDGITSGCTATTYCPESSVTRAQMAVFVLRSRCGAGYVPNTPGAPTFSDVPLSHPFVAYIEKMYSLGITSGCATGPLRYCPDAEVTRGQMSIFVERAYPFITPSEACSL
jgi:peptidyl-Asp metalloendopeptidase